MNDKQEQLAIIRKPGYGNRDVGYPVLFFDVYISEGTASLQVFAEPRASEIIKDSGVHDIHDLDGKPCWVTCADGFMSFRRMAKI